MRFPTLFLGAAAALAVALPATLVHTRLVKAEPGIDATVATAPKQIRLWWSDRTDAALTSATPAVRSVRVVRSAMYACVAGPVPEPSSAKMQRAAIIIGNTARVGSRWRRPMSITSASSDIDSA